MVTPTIFSGIQPSGQLMLGNYIGAIKPWLGFTQSHSCYFCLVDQHSITVKQNPDDLHKQTLDALAIYLACGLDPTQSCLFLQSHVSEHSQLAWVLQCLAQMGQLERMTQYKDKKQIHTTNINAGLFTYPVLMAADILLYQSTHVPVGKDQKQHLELARDLATRFNHYYGETFIVPEPIISKVGSKIFSLQDPSKKMSKSDPNDNAVIRLLDPPEVIAKKIKRSVTDSLASISYDPETQPGVSNLLVLKALATSSTPDAEAEKMAGLGYGDLKAQTAEVIIELLKPIQERYTEFRKDETMLHSTLKQGAQHAKEKAHPVLERVYKAIGFVLP